MGEPNDTARVRRRARHVASGAPEVAALLGVRALESWVRRAEIVADPDRARQHDAG